MRLSLCNHHNDYHHHFYYITGRFITLPVDLLHYWSIITLPVDLLHYRSIITLMVVTVDPEVWNAFFDNAFEVAGRFEIQASKSGNDGRQRHHL